MRGQEAIFVYGSLRRGMHQHYRIAGSTYICDSITAEKYTLYDTGSWPAAVIGGATAIRGEVYLITDQALAEVDAYEQHPRLFCRTSVMLADQRLASIWLYASSIQPNWKVVASGDWALHGTHEK